MYVCMYVCMYVYVCNRFTMEIYQFMRTFWHVPLMMPLHDVEIEVSERWLTAQQKDER